MTRFFEDITIGEEIDLGAHTFSREEIIAFARRFDPQPFHMDEAAAERSLFGGLCASGWHTATVWTRLMAQHHNARAAALASASAPVARLGPSPGFRELKWFGPVYPGDVIRYRSIAEEKLEPEPDTRWGLVVTRNEGVNQAGETVFSCLAQVYVERRAP